MQRRSSWRTKPAERVTRPLGWAAQSVYGICHTAAIRWANLRGFFGFLSLPEADGGRGLREERLSLALVSDSALVWAYAEFRRQRAGDYNGEVSCMLDFCLAILRPETGYLYQKAEFGARLLAPITDRAAWEAWCRQQREAMRRILQALTQGRHIRMTRDPGEPIQAILDRQHPVGALLEMVERMQADAPGERTSAGGRAAHRRDCLLVKMLISNPLRVHHYALMSYREDNTGNLYQSEDGAWKLRFAAEDFKNQHGAAHRPYSVTLSRWLWADIEAYLHQYRPLLRGAAASERVFLPQNGNTHKPPPTAWGAGGLSEQILKLTARYIPGSPGFGPHAFRHLVATEYLKNHPHGYRIVADILHDRLSTVRKAYAHLQVADGFAHWLRYLGASRAAYREGRGR